MTIQSLTLREGRRLMVFGNSGLRKIFGFKRDELTGHWRKLDCKVLCDLYISPNIIQVIKSRRKNWECHVQYWGEERCVQGLGGKF